MQKEAVQLLLRIFHIEHGVFADPKPPAVADLAARFGIERGLIDDHRPALPLLERLHACAILDQGDDLARCRLGLVAKELGGAQLLFQLEPYAFGRGLARTRPRLPRSRLDAL